MENKSFNIVDIKPDNMEDLTEVFLDLHRCAFCRAHRRGCFLLLDAHCIRCHSFGTAHGDWALRQVISLATFHPIHCNIFAYSTSRGVIRLADMRRSAQCNNHAQLFHEPDDYSKRTFFSEIISSISDIKFSQDGRYRG